MRFDAAWLQGLAERPELLTPEEMARADALSPRLGVPGPMLMANAGRAVARAVRRRFRPCRTLVLCGPGNNGGDGYVAARLLAEEGWPVSVAALAPPRDGSDAAGAARCWRGPMADFSPHEAARAELVIDAVFGAGLARDVTGGVAETLARAARIVAIDVPSGVDGATGAVRGHASRATMTVTFFRLKPGHLLLPGRDLCGELLLADIGLPRAVLEQVGPKCWANGPSLWQVPSPSASGHKYTRGHVTVLGGAAMTGAARLAAAGARRAGAGMLTIAATGGADIYRTGDAGVIVSTAPLAELLTDERRKVWVCGPGLGADEARRALPALVAAERELVADADVFAAFAGNPDALRGATVLTPHEGEFTRVFGAPGPDRVRAAREAAARAGAVVLLKGSDTVIAAPDGRVAINASAPPWLATAGAGDVLAGMTAGLLAQGMPAWDAAAAAAWLHGRAAALVGPGMLAEDLPAALPRVLTEITRTSPDPGPPDAISWAGPRRAR
ncbi:MAG: NAD(P)H-hydrate dehydratase [Alphaproteobacteria bacterium]|nr:NAD(P)H-hydrate dehydratase [Alphaproteobacteria bacterium]